MKKSLLLLVVFLITGMTINTFGQTSPDYIFGDNNGSLWTWGAGTVGTASLGGTYKWQFAATATLDHNLKFGESSANTDGSGFWTNNSGGNLQYTGAGAMWNSYYYPNMGDGGAIYFAITSGNYYVIKTRKDPGNSNCNFAVFDNGAVAPVTITGVTNTTDATNLYVDVQLSGAKGANEKAWVRYTTDNWATSNTIEASSDQTGDKWRATIVKSSSIFEYYVYTTIQKATAPAEIDADFYAVNYANNGGLNYKANLVNKLNYAFSSAAGSWEYLADASAFTWNTTSANDEEYSTATNIGFSFFYCGTEYTQFQVSTNGFLRFGTELVSATATDALNEALRKVIAPLWDDLGVSATATDITYKLSGSAPNRVLTVEWKNVKWNKTAATANAEFQIKLYEYNGKFEYIYGTMGSPIAGAASIGINDATLSGVWSTFISVNVGAGGTNFHTSMVYPFTAIAVAPATNQKLTFTPQSIIPLNGASYTVGGTNPTWNTPSQMAQALNFNGVAGPVTINIRTGTYDDIIHLLNIAGTSAANTITIQKESGAVTISPSNGFRSGSASGTADQVIVMLGTDYTTFNGIDITDIGTNNTLRYEFGYFITNFSGTDGASNNTIKNTTITLSSANINTRGIRTSGGGFIGVTANSGTISNNTFQNITVLNSYMGIFLSGMNATYRDDNNKVTATSDYSTGSNVVGYNDIGNITISAALASDFRGVYADGQSNLLIERTEIRNMIASPTTTASASQIYSLWINTSNSNVTIDNCNIYNNSNGSNATNVNFVHGIYAGTYSEITIKNCKVYNLKNFTKYILTSAAGTRGIVAVSSGATNVYIYNNMVYDLKAPNCASTSVCVVRGIELQLATNFYLYNNTVYLNNDDPPSVSGTNLGHSSTCLQIGNFASSNLYMLNNILINKMGGSQTGTGYSRVCVIYTGSASNTSRIALGTDNNLFYIDNPTKTGYLTRTLLNPGSVSSSYLSLSDLQGSTNNFVVYTPRDANSVSKDITSAFTNLSPIDLHLINTDWTVYGQGQPTALVTTDIDGNARSTAIANGPVCIGADEYTATGNAGTTVDNPSPGDAITQTFTGVDGKKVCTILWTDLGGPIEAADFPSSITMTYTPGKRPVDNSGNPISDKGIDRMFTITPSEVGANWSALVRLYYNSSTELRGFTEANLRVNKRPEAGNGIWAVIPTSIHTTDHYAEFTATSFSTFGIDDGANPLPVELVSFNALPSGQEINIKWSTKTEVNSYQFVVERNLKTEVGSQNALWEKVGEVNASGNSNSPKEYSFTDKNLAEGKYSYRLKMIDNDGTFEYSQVVEVEVDVPNSFTLSQNYPNPFNPVTQIQYQLPVNSQVKLVIYTITGELVTTLVDENQVAGSYTVPFNASSLASGTYIYRLVAGDFVSTKKMVVLK